MSDYYPPPQNQSSQYGDQPPQYGPAQNEPSQYGYQPPQYGPPPGQPRPGYWPSQGQGVLNAPYPPGQQSGANSMGITGFVVGLLSLIFVWIPYLGMIGAVLGIIFSAVGMRAYTGSKGLAIAGLVLSIIAAVISLCGLIFWTSLIGGLAHP